MNDDLARALASAFLAGAWTPRAMARRGKVAVGEQGPWVNQLAREVHHAYPAPPADRPRELALYIAGCPPFEHVTATRVAVWLPTPTRMTGARWDVPVIDDLKSLANWLGVTPEHLDWFADRRSLERDAGTEPLRHYHRRWVTKRDGTGRLLEAPKREMKDLQRQVLHGILDRIPPHPSAHGFTRGRSALSGAAHHTGRPVVMRLDLEDFFGSVTAGLVYAVFRTAGYPEPVAHTLAGLCTTVTPATVRRGCPSPPVLELRARRHRLLSHLAAPHLPQGSPTSPALANLAALGLDRRLAGLAWRLGATYTRYADDLTFSGGRRLLRRAGAVVGLVEEIATDEGFRLNDAKTRVRSSAQRQLVTGLVVNEGLNVPRADYDRLRATLHDAVRNGPSAANRHGHADFRSHLEGRVAWAGATNPARAAKLQRLLEAIDWGEGSA